MITYRNELSADAYLELRGLVGWRRITPAMARTGLEHSAFLVTARDGDLPVGMARVISDHGYIYLIADVIVRPAYQGRGIGTALLERIDAWLQAERCGKPTMMVYLMTAAGKEGFYRRFGFLERPGEHMGAGMTKWLE